VVCVLSMELWIVGRNLPGSRFEQYSDVHIGLRGEHGVVDAVPADAQTAVFTVTVEMISTPRGPDLFGPYLHGARGARSVRLDWLGRLRGQVRTVSRAELFLPDPRDPVIRQAARERLPIGVTVDLTDANGLPLHGRIGPPAIVFAPIQ